MVKGIFKGHQQKHVLQQQPPRATQMIINHFQMLLQIVSCVTDDPSTFKSIPEGWLSATGGEGGGAPQATLAP